jgi:hypothetical protein
MAPLDPHNTAYYTVFYTVQGNQHSFRIRVAPTVAPSDIGPEIEQLFGNLDDNLYATTIDYVTFTPKDSTVSTPVTTSADGQTYGSGAGTTLTEPQYIDFVGRSSGGRRVRFTIFGLTDLGGDFRIGATEFASVTAVLAQLGDAEGTFLAVDGLQPIWKQYANTGLNSYWQRQQRA